MRILVILFLLAFPVYSFSQIGIKGGFNFANVSNASSINESNRSGFNLGVFISPRSKSIVSSRTELLFSRQGYNYKTATNSGNVNLDYIMMPQMVAINLSKLLQIQLGAQAAYLLNAKVDSSNSSGSSPYANFMDYYNRFDYGFGVGAEVHPLKGLLFGIKYNISLGKLYNDAYSGRMPNFASIDAKNNLVQVFTGWRFGKR